VCNFPPILTFTALLLASLLCHAQQGEKSSSVSILGGFANANSIDNEADAREITFDDGPATTATLNWLQGYNEVATLNYELLLARSRLEVTSELDNSQRFVQDIDIYHLHMGGTHQWNTPSRVQPYVGGGLGFSHYEPSSANADTRFSISGAVGINIRLTNTVALRIDARVFATFIDTDAAIFCRSSLCNFQLSSDVWLQPHITAGIVWTI